MVRNMEEANIDGLTTGDTKEIIKMTLSLDMGNFLTVMAHLATKEIGRMIFLMVLELVF